MSKCNNRFSLQALVAAVSATVALGVVALPSLSHADETCNSPFTPLIKGQEDLVYVWTLGVEGIGDGSDKLVTVDVRPGSKTFGKVIASLSTGDRGEAHHMGFTDDRRYMWAGALDSNKIFIFDIHSTPAKPKLVKTITDFAEKTGFVGPHTFYALPGRMLIQALSNTKDHGGRTGLVVYNNDGELINTIDMPTGTFKGVYADGYGYDLGINPQQNVLLTSSFTGWNNYMMDMGKLVKDPEAMKHFGKTMAIWDAKTLKPKKVFEVPGAPLEIRWSLKEGDNWAVTAAALTGKLWVVKQDSSKEWQAYDVGTIQTESPVPLPVDISLSADGKGLWANTFLDGVTQYWDFSDPMKPKMIYKKKIASQVNMVSQSFDGKRVYFTTSLLGNWDKKGKGDDQLLKMYNWDGKKLAEVFSIDFYKEKLGRAHHMKFQAINLKELQPLQARLDGASTQGKLALTDLLSK
ncbi:selenium-binding protein SBP56-related protein [Thiobacillus denitrificans]|uniref:selenium-binding protein SBP56-related protein n=1 Tax=Thiobacillus denitrificans TaxID=36861 RepID=UPI00037DFFC4|nr:selenium-binding protein SBP56-related protein [Thiobacillus denitrificans]